MFGGGKQPKGYTPNLGAILTGATISKPMKGMMSGLEMRPMVSSKKKKKGAPSLDWLL